MPLYSGAGIATENVGSLNTEVGSTAQPSITTGVNNTAVGYNANNLLTTGVNNSAFGTAALQNNTSSSYNTGIGENALHFVDGAGVLLDGDANTAVGYFSLRNVTIGQRNTAVGVNSGISATTSSNLTFLGYGADLGVADAGGLSFVTVIGAGAVNNVSNSVAIGRSGLDIVSLGGKQGNESFRAIPVVNQVNWVQATGSTTGNQVKLEAAGSDANISLNLVSKGTGQVLVNGSPIAGATVTPPVRQTVLQSSVDASGLPNFMSGIGTTTLTIAGSAGTPFIATASNGNADRIGTSVANMTLAGQNVNGTYYAYVDIAADGTMTLGASSLRPNYQTGGAYSIVNGQFTFNWLGEMTGKVGNGAAAVQTYRVFLGEFVVAANVISSVTPYALMGRYDSGLVATLPAINSAVSVNHNIGINSDITITPYLQCIIADNGYAVDDKLTNWCGANGTYDDSQPVWWNYKSCGFGTNSSVAFRAVPKGGGSGATALTAANWKYGFTVKRDF